VVQLDLEPHLMRLHPSFPLGLALAGTLAFAATAPVCADGIDQAAAVRFDAPALTITETSRSSVTLKVQAGESGAPSGFTLVWMKRSDYLARGGWANPGTQGVYSSNFYGFPTYNTTPGVTSYSLPSNGFQNVEAGDLFDETGVLVAQAPELESGTEYVFRVVASGDGVSMPSEFSPTVEGTTTSVQNCTYTQGYWKNHSEAWPVTSLLLGTVNYTQAQLLQIFNQPARGNGLIILAHQLIAAKLNILQGANPTPVAAVISAADAQIGGLVVPPIGAGFLTPTSVNVNAQTLDDFNNGTLGVPHCGSVPVRHSSWGGVKTIYR
jgi:hypothetical protein